MDGGCYHIGTSPLIFRANQWTGFYMISASIMKELKEDTEESLKGHTGEKRKQKILAFHL